MTRFLVLLLWRLEERAIGWAHQVTPIDLLLPLESFAALRAEEKADAVHRTSEQQRDEEHQEQANATDPEVRDAGHALPQGADATHTDQRSDGGEIQPATPRPMARPDGAEYARRIQALPHERPTARDVEVRPLGRRIDKETSAPFGELPV